VRARDIERVVKTVQSAGLNVSGVQVNPDSSFVVLTGDPPKPALTELQKWQAKRARAS
jgi:hypothetical protein